MVVKDITEIVDLETVDTSKVPTATDAIDLVRVKEIRDSIDVHNTNNIITFGAGAQKKVTEVSRKMLEGVKTKDTGPVGNLLVDMVTQMRGLDFDKIKPGSKVGFLGKLFGKIAPVTKFIQKYEEITKHISVVVNDLETNKAKLMRDVKVLDRLYATTLVYFHDLAAYIEAGNQKLEELDKVGIPQWKKTAEESGDMLDAQKLRDLTHARDALERKVHDLKLTRQVVMQSLPSIRMVQQNDTDLIEKINSQITNTIPAWEQQLAIAVTMWRTAEATASTRAVSDYSNNLLTQNAKLLRQSNKEAREEIERGIYDVEAVKAANEELIAAIGESIAIANAGKEKRLQASAELVECENKLKEVLTSAA